MRSVGVLVCVGLTCLLTSCSRQPAQEFHPTATIKDIMLSIVDPSADAIWESVATIVSVSGTEERAPQTDEEWATVRRSAVQLVEATNLLLMPGRHVAKPGEKSENPDVELGPPDIEKLITADRETFVSLVHGLHESALAAFNAIEAKNKQGLFDAGEHIDTACENCHRKYWYPPKPGEDPNK
jgi:hypothetical protein